MSVKLVSRDTFKWTILRNTKIIYLNRVITYNLYVDSEYIFENLLRLILQCLSFLESKRAFKVAITNVVVPV